MLKNCHNQLLVIMRMKILAEALFPSFKIDLDDIIRKMIKIFVCN